MKKHFTEPTMRISIFANSSIVTESGDQPITGTAITDTSAYSTKLKVSFDDFNISL